MSLLHGLSTPIAFGLVHLSWNNPPRWLSFIE